MTISPPPTRMFARLLRNAAVVVAVTAIFGFKAAEQNGAIAPAPLEIASR